MAEEIVFCTGGGCTAKLGPGALARVLEKLGKPDVRDENLLIGYDSSDDAAVYRISEDAAIVQTLDFFPPMVEDPYIFGQIAAANALSDVYAMGGDVKTALNIVCFPEQMDLNILGKILQGGNEKVQEAGGTLAGGHSIHDTGVKYGLSVMGTVHPNRIFANNGCREGRCAASDEASRCGDYLYGRKDRGSVPGGDGPGDSVDDAAEPRASEIVRGYRVHGCTDVTGFGFLGHLKEMLGTSFGAVIRGEKIPRLPMSLEYAGGVLSDRSSPEKPESCGRLRELSGSVFRDGGTSV